MRAPKAKKAAEIRRRGTRDTTNALRIKTGDHSLEINSPIAKRIP
ncbi:hypothetical protein [Methanosarcina horonobensis]|nr:hypothetical protein [Methanosarcina horonobensis]